MDKKLTAMSTKEICEEAGLNYVYTCNITSGDRTVAKIKAALMLCAKALSNTLGPYGCTTIIEDQAVNHLVTKDGLDVINRLRFDDPVANIVLSQLRNIASRQVMNVGDGSTSAIVIANSLYQAITSMTNIDNISFSGKDIVDMLNVLSVYFENAITSVSTPISDDFHELEKLARISMNNDENAGKTMREIYSVIGRYGYITTSTTLGYRNDTVEYTRGASWERGYLSTSYGTGYENGIVKYSNENSKQLYIFICKGRLDDDDIQMLGQVIGRACGTNNYDELKSLGKTEKDMSQLIILANAYSNGVKSWLESNRHISRYAQLCDLKITPIDIDTYRRESTDLVECLSLLTDCKIYDKSSNVKERSYDVIMNIEKYLGKLKSATIDANTTELLFDSDAIDNNELLKNSINKIVEEIDNKIHEIESKSQITGDDNAEIYYLQSKRSLLTKSKAIYHVGGATNAERESRERLIEDAIYACKSALKAGYIFGGNLAIPTIIKNNRNDLINLLRSNFPHLNDRFRFDYFIDSIFNAFIQSYQMVLMNASINFETASSIAVNCVNNNLFYDLKKHNYDSINETDVINPAMTDIEIMKSCFSIIGLLSTSNQILTSILIPEISK